MVVPRRSMLCQGIKWISNTPMVHKMSPPMGRVWPLPGEAANFCKHSLPVIATCLWLECAFKHTLRIMDSYISNACLTGHHSRQLMLDKLKDSLDGGRALRYHR